jgi:hypothetical protein
MPESKRIEPEQPEYRSLTAALAQGAAGGAAVTITQQALAKLGSLGKHKQEPKK